MSDVDNSKFIFPSALNEEISNDPKLGAERKVYYALRENLPKGFYLFYNKMWSDYSKPMRRKDGECDFILAHKDQGILFIEVKGGEISYDSKHNQWRSKDYHGNVHDIQDPIKQARKSEAFFRDSIKNHLQNIHRRDFWINTKKAIFLPDSGKAKMNLGAQMPLDNFVFMDGMDELMGHAFKILINEPNNSEGNYDKIGMEGIEHLISLIGKSFDLKAPLSLKLKEDKRLLDKLTEEQNKILELIKYQNHALIIGGAGTGKTTLAIEKAKISSKNGKKVLLICFNSPLKNYLERKISNKNVDIYTFHGYFQKISKEELTLENLTEEYNRKTLPAIMLDSISSYSPDYDIIIIDEGQDIFKEWWDPIFFSCKDLSKSSIYIFKDDNQKIYTKDDNNFVPKEINLIPYLLTENKRNTKNIFQATNIFYSGETNSCSGPRGEIIELIEEKQGIKKIKQIENLLNKLIIIEQIEPSEISILVGRSIEKTIFSELSNIGNYKITDASKFERGNVILDSIYRFKGLESKVVILTDIDDLMEKYELLYVAISRARLKLYLMGNTNSFIYFKKMFGANITT